MTPATSGTAAGAGANAVRGIQNEQTMQHLSQTAEGVAGAEMKLGFLEKYECSWLKYELLSVTCRDAEVRRQRTLSAYRELYGDLFPDRDGAEAGGDAAAGADDPHGATQMTD